MTPPEVVVFDSHLVFADALKTALSQWFTCLEATASLDVLAATIAGGERQFLVLSLGASTPELLTRIAEMPGADLPRRGVVLCEAANQALLEAACQVEVAGLLLAEGDPVELPLAIQLVASGKGYISPTVRAMLSSPPRRRPNAPLTRTERKVLKMRQEGMTVVAIAKSLKQHVKNVEKRLHAGKRKFGMARGQKVDFSTLDLG